MHIVTDQEICNVSKDSAVSWFKQRYCSAAAAFSARRNNRIYYCRGVIHWRIKTNQEINDIIKGQNIIGLIRKQRLNWLGHVERMTEDNNVKKIKRWKPIAKRPTGRPKLRWEDDVLEDIKNMNARNWKKVVQDREVEESSWASQNLK